MIYILKFRTNDLNPSKGKQIEFNQAMTRDFFNFTEEEYNIVFECHTIEGQDPNIKINVRLKLSPSRGDYKIYQNKDSSKDLKDFFLEDLHLNGNANIDDFFAIKKISQERYILYYIPRDTLFNDFFQKISDSQICFVGDNKKDVGEKPYQQIYYGAPGTGKSHLVDEQVTKERTIRTTFHPDTDYSNFVGCYKPTTIREPRYMSNGEKAVLVRNAEGEVLMEDHIVYEFVAQAFLQAYVKAWEYYADTIGKDKPKAQFLVIEEINRGNCAQIFGDLFQLLDRNNEGFSDYPIVADKDIEVYLRDEFLKLNIPQKITEERRSDINTLYKGRDVMSEVLSCKTLLLPNNLYIWATMNTSDQSLFPIDSAFKRRWDWTYVPISKGVDKDTQESLDWSICIGSFKYDWWEFLTKINKHIYNTTNSSDKQLGYFFCKAKNGIIDEKTFVEKVLFYLWNDVYKDRGFDDKIFKDKDDEVNPILSFDKFYETDEDGVTIVDTYGGTVINDNKVSMFLENIEVTKIPIEESSIELG